MLARTCEPQYAPLLEHEAERLGMMIGHAWALDPKRLSFTLARYKFVAKMFAGFRAVAEVGCSDAFASRIVQQAVGRLTVSDIDPVFIDDVRLRRSTEWPMTVVQHDMRSSALAMGYDGLYALDVLEHIALRDEAAFLTNCGGSLTQDGCAIFGMPSLESQHLASPISRAGHVNCKSGDALKSTLQAYFRNVFIFAMNDEVIHTGHFSMSHYLMALCTGPVDSQR